MSVLLEAMGRANARKDAVMEGDVAVLGFDVFLLVLSGLDIDPADLAGYMDAATGAFIAEWAMGCDKETAIHGLLAEGLLMGSMLHRVQTERDNDTPEPEPSITETAKTLASQVMVRAQQLLGRDV